MRYMVIETHKGVAWGFDPRWHRCNATVMVVSGKEVADSPMLEGTIEERAQMAGGRLVGLSEARAILNTKE